MHDNDFINQLRDRLHKGPDGLILPWTYTAAQRFRSASETLLFPLFRELAKELRDGGINATPFLEPDEDPPVVGICFETLSLALYFSPSPNPNRLTFTTRRGEPAPTTTHDVSYRNLTHGTIRTLVQDALKHAFFPSQPPL